MSLLFSYAVKTLAFFGLLSLVFLFWYYLESRRFHEATSGYFYEFYDSKKDDYVAVLELSKVDDCWYYIIFGHGSVGEHRFKVQKSELFIDVGIGVLYPKNIFFVRSGVRSAFYVNPLFGPTVLNRPPALEQPATSQCPSEE